MAPASTPGFFGKHVANEDLQINFSNQAGPPDILYSGDQGVSPPRVVPTTSTTCKAVAKYICTTGITLTWVAAPGCPHTSLLYTFVGGGGSVSVTSTKVKCDGGLVLRAGDTGTCSGFEAWVLKTNPTVKVSCACNVEISDAGQDRVSAQ